MITRRRHTPAVTARGAATVLAATLVLSGCTEAHAGARPGTSGVGDPYFTGLGNGGYDALHYGLTLAYTPGDGRLAGTAEITARATQDLSAFNLDLAGMNVSSATVDGAPASVARTRSELTLSLRHDLRRGHTFRAVVHYAGVPRTITDPDGSKEGWLVSDGGRRVAALGEPTGSMAWFPSDNRPGDKSTYDISVTVPSSLTAVSNGELRSRYRAPASGPGQGNGEGTGAGTTTYVWRTAQPMASYLATLAIGPYAIRQTRLPAATGTSPDGRPVTVCTATDPDSASKGRRLLDALPGIMAWEEKTFGPFPFSSTGVIIGRSGQAGYALETQNRPFLPGPSATSTLVHEMAHQWYGDAVTPATWRDMWLNEGFATYGEWLWLDSRKGKDRVPLARSFARAYEDPDNWAFSPADPPKAADISASPVYGRGAMVLQRVREVVGDTAFFRILRGWPRSHRYGNASTADFLSYAQKEAGARGKRLDSEVWRTWLYGTKKPKPKPKP
ncbi:M1 family metallopeptidase [Streptomyces sp. NBC_01497]|uniref:M1 family metallopeptidase n=1 Tax=Streptomyces sp. NBC_01497 TaxID=2903885 RepID=UPI002E2F86D1|nr:M1 family metallopeptidase [Streptomyces sp. NBC_01497]